MQQKQHYIDQSYIWTIPSKKNNQIIIKTYGQKAIFLLIFNIPWRKCVLFDVLRYKYMCLFCIVTSDTKHIIFLATKEKH